MSWWILVPFVEGGPYWFSGDNFSLAFNKALAICKPDTFIAVYLTKNGRLENGNLIADDIRGYQLTDSCTRS